MPSKDKKPKILYDKREKMMNTQLLSDVGYITVISLDEINPYDDSHFPFGDKRWKDVDKVAEEHERETWTEKSHIEGIQLCKEKILEGYIPRPILVFDGFKRQHINKGYKDVDWTKIRYQRIDGFKRYMALRELGYKWIIVQIVSTWIAGGQDGQPWVL